MEPAVLQPDEDAQAEINALQRQVADLTASRLCAETYMPLIATKIKFSCTSQPLSSGWCEELCNTITALQGERDSLRDQLASAQEQVNHLTADLARVTQERDNMRQWGIDRLAEKQVEIEGYIAQVRVLTESIAMTKTDWQELVKLRERGMEG